MEALYFALGSGVGALHAVLGSPDAIEGGDLGVLRVDAVLGCFHAGEFPLGDGHLLHVELLGARLRAPFGFEVVTKLVELLEVFAGQDDPACTKAVLEGVQADSGLALGSPGTG